MSFGRKSKHLYRPTMSAGPNFFGFGTLRPRARRRLVVNLDHSFSLVVTMAFNCYGMSDEEKHERADMICKLRAGMWKNAASERVVMSCAYYFAEHFGQLAETCRRLPLGACRELAAMKKVGRAWTRSEMFLRLFAVRQVFRNGGGIDEEKLQMISVTQWVDFIKEHAERDADECLRDQEYMALVAATMSKFVLEIDLFPQEVAATVMRVLPGNPDVLAWTCMEDAASWFAHAVVCDKAGNEKQRDSSLARAKVHTGKMGDALATIFGDQLAREPAGKE